jgi:DNA repair protein RadC
MEREIQAVERNQIMIRDVPEEERPRERMLQFGAEALSNAELLAILLRTGYARESALSLAQRLLVEAEGLSGLMRLRLEELMQKKGIGLAKAVQVKAGIELGRRIARDSQFRERVTIRTPRDAAHYMMEEMRYLAQEHFVVLFLNTKNQVSAHETIFVGSLNASIVHPREVFQAAIKRNSASIICLHNHPSGDPTPSPEDVEVTRRLVEAGKILGIEVLDHIIIGDRRYTSMKEKGFM